MNFNLNIWSAMSVIKLVSGRVTICPPTHKWGNEHQPIIDLWVEKEVMSLTKDISG